MATDTIPTPDDAPDLAAQIAQDFYDAPPAIDPVPGNDVVGKNPFTLDHDLLPYKQNLIDTEFVLDTGRRVAPIAGDGTESGVAYRLHNGTMLKIFKWSIERAYIKGTVPHYDTGDPNEVLVKAVIYPALPLVQQNKRIFRISGMYVYQLLIPKTLERGSIYPCGASAAEEAYPSQGNYYDAADFSKLLSDAGYAPEASAKPFTDGASLPLTIPSPMQGGYLDTA